MHKVGEKLPFDVSAYRSIEFSLEKPSDLKEARLQLKGAVEAVLAPGYKVVNPVTHARGVVQIQEQATDTQRVLLDEIAGLKDRVTAVEKSPPRYVVVEPKINSSVDGGGLLVRSIVRPSKTKPWEGSSAKVRAALSSALRDSDQEEVDELKTYLAEAVRKINRESDDEDK